MNAVNIQERQKRRYQLLLQLWNAADGKRLERIDFMKIAQDAGFDYEEAKQIYLYFKDEEFFEYRTQVWGVSLSHKAIVEIERSLTNPSEGTEHFSATVIQNFNAPVGAVQTGASSSATIMQSVESDHPIVEKDSPRIP